MWVHVLMGLMSSPQLPAAVVLTATYGELHPGFSGVPICLYNLSAHSIEIPTRTVVGQVVPANQVPPVVLLTGASEESNSNPQKGWVLEALDLQGLGEWPNLSKNRPRSCCLNGNTYLPAVTLVWVGLP